VPVLSADSPTSRSVLRGIAVFAWITWLWSTVATVVARDRVERPWLAVVLLGAVLLVDVALARAVARRGAGVSPALVVAELVVGYAVLAGEGWVFSDGHAFSGRQGLAGGWPAVGVITVGVLSGPVVGAVAGAAMGTGRIVSALANGVRSFDADEVASLAATVVFYAVFGGVAGWVGRLLRRAEQEVAIARAREEVARTMHDTVLQTLAVTVRRTRDTDPDLARLARDADRDLRAFLDGPVRADAGGRRELLDVLREAASTAARPYDLDVTVSAVGDRAAMPAAAAGAVAGAVGEAVTNVGKHAGARRVTVFADTDGDEVLVTVRDDGDGFDPAAVPADARGLRSSIVGRMVDAGGRAEVVSAPGRGTEVRLWIR
jgi:signal transduction histidine kinase